MTLKANDLQSIIFTTNATDINVSIISLYLFVSGLIPHTDTQVMFNESFKNNYTITYDSWFTERKLSTNGNELQVDIDSGQPVNSPKNLIGSFQTADRKAPPNKINNIASFDNVNVRKCFCEIDGYRNPKDGVLTNFPENDYLDQYIDLKLFYNEFVDETLLNPFSSYTGMKYKYTFQVIDLRHQIDHESPQTIHLFEDFNHDLADVNARFFVELIRQRQIEKISDGNKIITIKII